MTDTMPLRLHNTLTKKLEEFIPRDPGVVGMYVCGPTVYENAHLGHMRAALVFDVLRRYLQYRGYKVTHVQNVTDIEDKIINKAREEGVSTEEITQRYGEEYHEAIRALNILPWDFEPRATDHIQQMIDMIDELVKRGSAYYAEGDVYFDVTTLPDYGKLSGQKPDELKAGARVEPGEFKRHPADFALWKRAKPGEPSWDSPWGRGRPGWHIECSAMSLKYLGMGFDIHGGGDDLIFPHHENEIAQAEAYAGTQPFVRYWLHNAMVMTRGEKMSKSLHNYFTVSEALRAYRPEVVRYALIAVHYRKPLDFEVARLDEAYVAVENIRTALASIRDALHLADRYPSTNGNVPSPLQETNAYARQAFIAAMDDDLNTSAALAAIFDLVTEANRAADAVQKSPETAAAVAPSLRSARDLLHELLGVLGLEIAPREGGQVYREEPEVKIRLRSSVSVTFQPGPFRKKLTARVLELATTLHHAQAEFFPQQPPKDLEELIAFILQGRERARAAKNFKTADQIRIRLAEAGILVKDLPEGPRWSIATPDAQSVQ